MSKCKYWDSFLEEQTRYTKYGGKYTEVVMCGRCTGTKETERCYCNGHETRCDFYPETKERALKAKEAFLNRSKEQMLVKKERIKQFVFAGRAVFTIESAKTGKQFTYKVYKSDVPDTYIVRWLDYEEDAYRFVGVYYADREFFKLIPPWINMGKEWRPVQIRAIEYFFAHINDLPDTISVYHEGRCARCGRPLTDEKSLELGFGPECFRMENKQHDKEN